MTIWPGSLLSELLNIKFLVIKFLEKRKKRISTFNMGRIIWDLHFPKLQWLKGHYNQSCRYRPSLRRALALHTKRKHHTRMDGCHMIILPFYFCNKKQFRQFRQRLWKLSTGLLCSWLQLSGNADCLNWRRLRNRPWCWTFSTASKISSVPRVAIAEKFNCIILVHSCSKSDGLNPGDLS